MGQVHLVQDPALPSFLGTGPALTPNLLASVMRGERNAKHIPRAAVQGSRDIARESLSRLDMVQNCAIDIQ